MAKNLVIVESPAKAKTMGRFLGKDYVVKASMGHVRDLPERTRRGDLGVDIENNFKPRYEVPDSKKKVVAEIKAAAKGATTIYLATDPDREGEAISWHLLESAGLDKLKAPKKRVVFHEITKDAITNAFKHPREIDMELVDAQQARRILDRVVGYKLSPLLWKKIEMGLSAGRVQSAALRMIVEREREIQAFQVKEFWTIEANLFKRPENVAGGIDNFMAEMVNLSGVKEKIEIDNGARAQELTADLDGASYKVTEITRKETQRRPAAPFITSTLQQDASVKLRFTGKRTMAIAQQLYEGVTLGKEGSVALITYMRTDSTNVSPASIHEAREYIQKKFGKEYLPSTSRVYTKKVAGAQEAHEAIRPISVLREPSSLAQYLDRDQLRLYELIWKRMVASQMNNAIFDSTTVDVTGVSQKSKQEYIFRATGSVLKFPGFRVLYEVEKDDDTDDDGKKSLPELNENEPLDCREIKPEQHFTKPPPRYTEASLIKELEENGIGRPSTYAPIISTIMDRGYVEKEDRALVPQSRGFLVNDLLIGNFPDIFDLKFTADMENRLDEIARGKRKWVPFLKEFYKPFAKDLTTAEKNVSDEATDQLCPEGHPMLVKVGRFGRFMACSLYPKHKYTQRIVVAKPVTDNIGGQLSEPQPEETSELCPEGHTMIIREGKFGKFLACSKFPEHKFTKPILNKTGVLCPKDKGELVERQAFSKKLRRKVTFYGCSNYPECDFTVSQKPLPDPCPECDGLMIRDGKDGAKCTVCAYKTANEKVGVEA